MNTDIHFIMTWLVMIMACIAILSGFLTMNILYLTQQIRLLKKLLYRHDNANDISNIENGKGKNQDKLH